MLQRFLSGRLYEIALHRAQECSFRSLKLFFPVICSAATLAHAISDYQSLIPWLRMRDHRRIVVPWFARWFTLKTRGDLALVVTTIAGGCIARRSTFGWGRQMYLHGALFASWHLILALDIGHCARKIVHYRTDTRDAVRLFLRYHTFRILTADVPAFFCFLEAFRHATASMIYRTFITR